MFANLKNKLLEEVKASPSKFQQLATAAQAAVSSAPNTTSNLESIPGTDNFFSITEEDTPQNSPFKLNEASAGRSGTIPKQRTPNLSPNAPGSYHPSMPTTSNGAMNRTRRLSNSSMASDISFRLPSYDSPAVYHLQSDLDVSASEIEDNSGSTRLDLISKEQLHDAYKKALDRYQKYRGRYTDLAKKYKDLERDSTKARTPLQSVLVETQDKAIRRISELREQCVLEQQAKAHLEEALRMEMDDMQCKINSYQTKITLLGNSAGEQDDSLIQLVAEEKNLISLDSDSSGGDKIAKLEKLLEERNKEIEALNSKLEDLRKREEDNTIIMAQNKLEIHSELDNKESELKKLKLKVTETEKKFEQSEKDKVQLSKQVAELKDLKDKLKQVTATKQELDAKLISTDHILGETKKELKEKDKNVDSIRKSLEVKLQKVTSEYEEKVRNLEQQKTDLNELLARQQESAIVLAEVDNESNRVKTENHTLRELLAEQRQQIEQMQNSINDLEQKRETYLQLEEKIRIENSNEKVASQKLSDEVTTIKSENEKVITQLKKLEEELQDLSIINGEQRKELELTKSALLEKENTADKCETLSKQLSTTNNENENLSGKIKQLEIELQLLSTQNEKTDSEAVAALKEALQKANVEHNDQTKMLQGQITEKEVLLVANTTEIAKLQKQAESAKLSAEKEKKKLANSKDNLKKSEVKLTELGKQKSEMEERMSKENQDLKTQVTNILKDISEMEQEIKNVQKSHTDLEKEKQHLEKKIEKMTKQNQNNAEGNQKSQVMLHETEEKLKQVESKLQNVQSENTQLAERNCLLEENSNRLEKLIAENEVGKTKAIQELETELDQTKSELQTAKKSKEKMSQVLDENSRLHNAKEIMEHELKSLQDKCEDREKEKLCLLDSNKCLETEIKSIKEENENLVRENTNLGKMSNDMRSDLDVVNGEKQAESSRSAKLQNDFDSLLKSKQVLEEELQLLNLQQNSNDTLQRNSEQLNTEIDILKSQNQDKSAETIVLKDKLNAANEENKILTERNAVIKNELDSLNNNNQIRLKELESMLQKSSDENQSLQETVRNATDLEKKLRNYDQIQIENEYLKTLTTQIETDLRNQRDGKTKVELEVAELQNQIEALKSIKEKQQDQLEAKEKEMSDAGAHTAKLIESITEKSEQIERLQVELSDSKKSILDLTIDFKSATKLLQKLENIEVENEKLQNRIKELKVEHIERITALKNESTLEAVKNNQQESENLRKLNEQLQRELEDLKYSSSAEISNLTQEIDDMGVNFKHASEKVNSFEKLREERDRMSVELRELREGTFESPIGSGNGDLIDDNLQREKDELEEKLKKIMHEVQDVSNRNLFLEQKCENFLILEQSNERMKLANEKLSRQLDETLVSMQHNEGISANTEFEYLKNIMFQYLTGTVNGNNDTLVKVISAVLKFSPQQTQVAIEKEHQRRSVL